MENNQETKPVTQTEPVKEEKTEVSVTQTEEKTEEKAEGRTFTQEEVNAMLAKERKKIPNKEDLKAFNDWKESQKTEAEKQSEFNQKLTDTTNENISLKQENLVLKSGVNADDADYVVYKVSKMDGEFEDNLKVFLKDNPKYLQKKETVEVPKTTGIAVSKIDNSDEDGVVAILKSKHPEAFK